MTELSEGISLGWNCDSAIYGVVHGLRKTKNNGYKTCPFDEMITNYQGIINCIEDDFKYLCDIEYLELIQISKDSKWLNTNGDGDIMIYNKKYNFIFNHESPGHANLYITQKWSKGINHYILNNYEEFRNRYNRRIDNIKELLNSNKNISFIISRPFNDNTNNTSELENIIKNKYPQLNFKIITINCDKNIYEEHFSLMTKN
jgi:hypothetical protein